MDEFAKKFKSAKRPSGLIVPDNDLDLGIVRPDTTSDFDSDKEEREQYNKGLPTLDAEYTNFIPTNKVLIRCKVLEYEELSSGILTKPTIMVPVRTKSGVGFHADQESPYPYSREAIIVSVPKDFQNYKAGDVVIIPNHMVLATKAHKDSPFHMPNAFTLPEWKELEPPHSMKSKHYGYLLISHHEIQGKINETESN